MASQLILDTKDPATQELVAGWADNTEYTVQLTIRTGAGANRNKTEVVGAVEETAPEDVEEPAAEAEPAAAPGPAAVSRALAT